jgi:hypothetical protein
MNKSAKGEGGRKAARGPLWLHLPGMVREALYDTVLGAGLACVDEVLEMERVALCGERYEHLADRHALRAGHVASSLVLGGRRVAVNRPRARSVEGRELRLPSWREWSARDPLDEQALGRICPRAPMTPSIGPSSASALTVEKLVTDLNGNRPAPIKNLNCRRV